MLLLLDILLYLLLIAIFIRVAFSWIGPPDFRNPIYRLSYQVTEPLLAPVRNLLPQRAGLDLSPMIVTLLIFLILAFIRG